MLSVAEKIEDARVPSENVFSYRLDRDNYKLGDLFRRDVSWLDFYRASRSTNEQNEGFVLVCDIADCYGRIGHHKLDNALRLIDADDATRKQLRRYLTHLSGDRSSGLPVGGPASRILAELALNNVDTLMLDAGYNFVRYADDYHIFCKSRSDAHRAILDLSSWLDNDGLILQRSKTRIMSKAEFAVQCALILGEDGIH